MGIAVVRCPYVRPALPLLQFLAAICRRCRRRRKELISPFCQLQRRGERDRGRIQERAFHADMEEEGWGTKWKPFLPHMNRSDFQKDVIFQQRRPKGVSCVSASACLCQSRPIDPGSLCQEITRVTETCYFSSFGFPGKGETAGAGGAYEIRTQFFISGIGDL